MSPLLAFAVVLLVIVAGLLLMQRRAQSQPRTGRPSSEAPTPPPSSTPPPSAPPPWAAKVTLVDPVLGTLLYDDDHAWRLEGDDLAFVETMVNLEIAGGPDGPDVAAREYMTEALAQQADLDARARALIVEEARSRGVEATLLDPYELQARHDDDGALRGYLWYDINDAEAEFGVSSVDLWRTLKFETLD